MKTVQLALEMQQAIISEFSGSAGASTKSVRIPTNGDGDLSITDVNGNSIWFKFNENTYEFTSTQCELEKRYDYPTTMSLADELSDIIQDWLDSAVAV